MATWHCRVGCSSDTPQPQGLVPHLKFIDAFFRTETAGNVRIKLDTAPLNHPFPVNPPGAITAFDLHTMLRRLTGNPLDARKVDTIALIFARRYRGNRSAFGMMFDEGYVHGGDPADDVTERHLLGPPREGCAVFIDAIAAARGGRDGDAFNDELVFTTLHELGHVFNLQHQGSPPNIMKPSASHGPVPPAEWALTKGDRLRLRRDPLPATHYPGASPFGRGASANDPSAWRFSEEDETLDLQMFVRPSHTELHSFEPIELDVEIALAAGPARRRHLPNIVDPGYEAFRIWIEEPTGARRVLRSPRRYCGGLGRIVVSDARPFRRDISIGRQAGGPVFQVSGVHHVWVELNLGSRGMLRSNRVPIRIKDDIELSQADQAAKQLFGTRAGVVLGYSRVWDGEDRMRAVALELEQAYPSESWSPLLRYSIIRAAIDSRERRGGASDEALGAEIEALIGRAVDDPLLGAHRRDKLGLIQQHSPARHSGRRRSNAKGHAAL